MVDLRKVGGVDIDFFFYYSMDIGGNPHKHDVEYIEARLAVARRPFRLIEDRLAALAR